jgi:hypothetical protein
MGSVEEKTLVREPQGVWRQGDLFADKLPVVK